jgi:hypothetical protein
VSALFIVDWFVIDSINSLTSACDPLSFLFFCFNPSTAKVDPANSNANFIFVTVISVLVVKCEVNK